MHSVVLLLPLLGCSATSERPPEADSEERESASDSGCLTSWYADADGDGYGAESSVVEACTAPAGLVGTGGDCDDADARVFPGAPYECRSGRDLDCDGVISGECAPDDVDALLHYSGSGGRDARGDLDGDGLADLMLGDWGGGSTGDGWAPGHVYVFSGADIQAGATSFPLEPSFALTTIERGFGGYAVAWIDDIDGDGGSEILTAANGALYSTAWVQSHVQLVLSSEVLGGTANEPTPYFGIEVDPKDGPEFGSVVSLGDVDGDERGDFGISYGDLDAGVYGLLVYSGGALPTFDGWAAPQVRLALDGVGIGAMARVPSSGEPLGLLAITSLSSTYQVCLFDLALLVDGAKHTLSQAEGCYSLDPTERISPALAATGDIDGDGEAEVLFGFTGVEDAGYTEGVAILPVADVLAGGGPALVISTEGPQEYPGYWGEDADASSDLDGGGRADVVVGGSPPDANGGADGNRTIVVRGEDLPWGGVRTIDEADWAWNIPSLGYGAIVVGGGDFSGDGRADLVSGGNFDTPLSVIFAW